jgi:thiosulfate/3-mercaptopyruvate sulfurtransferase
LLSPLFEPERLLERLGAPGLVVVDCQWRLGDPGAGERDWLASHIPGAPHLDVEGDLSAPGGAGGRHPLPEPEAFAAAARRAGISSGNEVVAYDEAGAGGAARLWWLLRHHGHEAAFVLDGGLAAWRELGGPLRSGPEEVEPGDFVPGPPADDVVSADELLARLGEAGSGVGGSGEGGPQLLDARVPERYRGETEPIDPVAGHIPGARNVPFAEVAPGGRFRPPAELRERLATEREAVAYCGSGVSACMLVLAAEAAGLPRPRLYPGSWSEWSTRGLPVQRG